MPIDSARNKAITPHPPHALTVQRTSSQPSIGYMSMLAMKLDKNKKLHRFFISVSDEGNSIKWCKLNRVLFRTNLSARYSKKLADRIMTFLESNFGSLLRATYDTYSRMLKDFVRGGGPLWRKFLFFVFNLSGNDRLCEHDLFQILEQFK